MKPRGDCEGGVPGGPNEGGLVGVVGGVAGLLFDGGGGVAGAGLIGGGGVAGAGLIGDLAPPGGFIGG